MGAKTPNLFILGAPKCGTTALSQWLGMHPEIYAPPTKEPHHFSKEYCLTPDRIKYEMMYQAWSSDQRWAFDASVWSLFSPTAVANILLEQPGAHFIVMLRNPVEMIPSMHRQQIFNGNELELDLGTALSLSDRREAGEGVSVLARYPSDHLAYYHSCALGWQIERLMAHVAPQKLHVILHDELARSPEIILTDVYKFLALEPVMPINFKKVNSAKVRQFPWLDKTVKSLGDWKHKRGITWRTGALSWLRRVNRKHRPLPPLSKGLASGIQDRMEDDLRLLGSSLDRDLAYWLDSAADRP